MVVSLNGRRFRIYQLAIVKSCHQKLMFTYLKSLRLERPWRLLICSKDWLILKLVALLLREWLEVASMLHGTSAWFLDWKWNSEVHLLHTQRAEPRDGVDGFGPGSSLAGLWRSEHLCGGLAGSRSRGGWLKPFPILCFSLGIRGVENSKRLENTFEPAQFINKFFKWIWVK